LGIDAAQVSRAASNRDSWRSVNRASAPARGRLVGAAPAAAHARVDLEVKGNDRGEALGDPLQVVEVLAVVHRQVQVAADQQAVGLVGASQLADGRQHQDRAADRRPGQLGGLGGRVHRQ
jgi:hypothetical protein